MAMRRCAGGSGDVGAADENTSARDLFEAGDQAQRRRLAAARRAEQHDQRSRRRLKAHMIDRRRRAPELADVLHRDLRHRLPRERPVTMPINHCIVKPVRRPGGAGDILCASHRPGHDLDPGQPVPGRHLGRGVRATGIPAAFPCRRRGRARAGRSVDDDRRVLPRRHAKGRRYRERHRRHRHHQSARDHVIVGSRQRARGASRHRLAGPAHGGFLCAPQGRRPRRRVREEDRASARSVFFRHQTRLAVGLRAECSRAGRARRARVRHRRYVSACGGSPAARCTPPTPPMPRARCCSISIKAAGTIGCWHCSACQSRFCRRCWIAPPRSA